MHALVCWWELHSDADGAHQVSTAPSGPRGQRSMCLHSGYGARRLCLYSNGPADSARQHLLSDVLIPAEVMVFDQVFELRRLLGQFDVCRTSPARRASGTGTVTVP